MTPPAEPLLLVMGLGGPMTWWSPEFCRRWPTAGFFVIRYDNRDTGRSSRAPGRVTRRMLVQTFVGPPPARPGRRTRSTTWPSDGFGLLDHLGLESAHVVGISMGGMIVQTMALLRPDRVRSLTSIMSTTGRRTVGWQDPRLLPRLLERRASTREAYVDELGAGSGRSSARRSTPTPSRPSATGPARPGTAGVSAAGVARQMVAIVVPARPDPATAGGRPSPRW